MMDLGDLHYFLGTPVTKENNSLFWSQKQYALDILERAGMTNCRRVSTPMDMKAKLSGSFGPPIVDPAQYRALVSAPQYLTFTRLDLTYAVQQICLFMHDP